MADYREMEIDRLLSELSASEYFGETQRATDIVDEIKRRVQAQAALLAVLHDCVKAISSLSNRDLGFGMDGDHVWSLRDELLDKARAAIALAEEES